MRRGPILPLFITLAVFLMLVFLMPAPAFGQPAAAAAEAPWPSYQRGRGNGGRSPYAGPTSEEVKWSLAGQVDGGVTAGSGGALYAGSGSALVALHDRGDTCILSWFYDAGSRVVTLAVVDAGGNIVFGCENGDILKLSASGDLIWRTPTGEAITSHPALDAGGNIYIALGQDLVKLSPGGGLLWSKHFERSISGTPAIDEQGRVCVGAAVLEYGPLDLLKLNPQINWYLYTLNPDGSLYYRFGSPSNSAITSSPSISGEGNLVFATEGGEVVCLDEYGRKLWQWNDPDGSPVLNGFALGGDGDVYYCSQALVLRRLDGQGAGEIWRAVQPQGSDPRATPVLDRQDRVYVPGKGARCYSPSDGSVLWSLEKDQTALPTLALGESSTLYLSIPSGTGAGVYAVGPRLELPSAPEPSPGYDHIYYLAEGTTRQGFLEFLSLANPNEDKRGANVQVTYLMPGGAFEEQRFTLLPESRMIVDVAEVVGPERDVSIRVASTLPIVVERPMFFVYQGLIDGGHDALGVTGTSQVWYFAEGCTRDGFFEYLCIQNPGSGEAGIELDFMIQGEGLRSFYLNAAPTSRTTVNVRDMVGHGKDVSVKVSSDCPVVVERPMYFVYQGLGSHLWTGGHNAVGAAAAGRRYYFAEGTTRCGFEEWLCLQNPSSISEIVVRATYFPGQGQGEVLTREYAVPPNQRYTVCVNNEIGPDKDVSVLLESDMPFVAERPMYFDYKSAVNGGSNVIGTGTTSERYAFAYGTLQEGFEQWLCVLNPSGEAVDINVTYLLDDGEKVTTEYTVEAAARFTRYVGHDVPYGSGFFVVVEASGPFIAEMASYFKSGDISDGWSVLGLDE